VTGALSTVPQGIAGRFLLLWGWQRLLAACLTGAVAALATPPYSQLAALFAFTPLVWLIDGAGAAGRALPRLRSAFAVGWAFGFGYFLTSLWWIGVAFLVDADVFAWIMPLGVVGLPALLAVFTGVGAMSARLVWSAGPQRVAALAFGLGLAEWLRGHVLTGFPWSAFGTALTGNDVLMQGASLVGVEGLSVLAVLIGAAPATLGDPPTVSRRARLAVPLVALALLAGQAAFGVARLAAADDSTVPDVRLRLVQPNLSQADRRDAARHGEVFERYLRLTSAPRPDGARPTHVLWPESALPFATEGAAGIFSRIARAMPQGASLIAGLQRAEEGGPGVFNSLYVFDSDARVLERYDKVHLVPFGEYLPFPDLMARIGLEPLTRVFAFVPGTRRVPIATAAAPRFSPLICYEVIFSGEVTGDGERPGWLVNLSDDSWFGDTPGPRQHLHQARLRAVEEGIPLVRATTTGASAVIDGYGRLRESVSVGSEATLDTALPVALPATLFAQARSLAFWTLLILMLVVAVLARSS
jgi:apolipoprotein N-acyltransferase